MYHKHSVSRPANPNLYLRFFPPSPSPGRSIRWRINGYPARLFIWSLEEWEQLPEHPDDAQLHPLGLWCALRLDEA